MSADSPSEPPPEPGRLSLPPSLVPPSDQEPEIEAPKLPTRKQRYRKPDETGGDPDEAALQSALQAVRQRPHTVGNASPARPTVNRFVPSAANSGASADAHGSLPGGGSRATEAEPVLPKFRPWTFAETTSGWERNRGLWIRGSLYSAAGLLLVLVAFLVGRDQSPRSAPAPVNKASATAGQWQPGYTDRLAKALAADHAGDLTTALRLIDELSKDLPSSPALAAYRETLNTRLGSFFDAEASLVRWLDSNTAPDVSATINAARGFNFVRKRQFDSAPDCFAAVALADPFDATNLLHWGETLRRNGNLEEAVAKFQDALSRLPVTTAPSVEAQREYIAYEQRLTQIEEGRQAELQPELDQYLGAPAPSGYWLMTAAAVALEKRDMPGAADALKKAQVVFPPDQFRTLLADYFFHSFASRPELKVFPMTSTPEQLQARQLSMDYFIDP